MLHSKSDDDVPAAAVAVAVAADPPLANAIEYEAIPKLLFVDMQQEDEDKVAAAVTKLADLLSTSNANWKVNTDEALYAGVIAIILLLMRKWHHNRSIQFHGCCLLAWLTCPARGGTHSEVSIVKSGGSETIIAGPCSKFYYSRNSTQTFELSNQQKFSKVFKGLTFSFK